MFVRLWEGEIWDGMFGGLSSCKEDKPAPARDAQAADAKFLIWDRAG